jgi:monoamine oxidase
MPRFVVPSSHPTAAPSYPHVTIHERLADIARLNRGKKRVTVLGAGMAGLAAAHELARLGHEVEVLEGSERVGGRVHTARFDDGSYAELGAMRVPKTHDYTHHYIGLLDLPLHPFVNSVPENFVDLRGKIVRASESAAELMPLYDLPATLAKLPSGGAVFGALLDHAVDCLTDRDQQHLFTGKLDSDLLRSFDALSLGEFLHKVSGPGVRAAVADFTCLEPFWDLSLGVFLREELQDTGDNLTTIRGGMAKLPVRLAEAVEAQGVAIRRNVEVRGIEVLAGGRVQLRLLDEGVARTQVCENVVCTLPFSVLRRLDLRGISQAKRDAIMNLHYVSAYKLAIHCKERFWEQNYGICGGASVSDQIYRQVYYPQDHMEVHRQAPLLKTLGGRAMAMSQFSGSGKGRGSKHTLSSDGYLASLQPGAQCKSPGALLIYNWGQDAVRLGHLTLDQQVDVALDRIARFHPEIREFFVDATPMCWDTNPWTSGAFSLWRPGQLAELWPAVTQAEGSLRFAGEHCSTDNGWIQGALESSLRVVLDIASAPMPVDAPVQVAALS